MHPGSGDDQIDAHGWARRLLAAEQSAMPLPPLSATDLTLTVADAYAIQREGRELRVAAGARVVGRKVGLTSHAMQEMLGVDQPDLGYLLDTMVLNSGAQIDASELIAPRVEAEIAFYLESALAGPGVERDDVLECTAAVAPALEIIDSRIADWQIAIEDTIADNASSAAAVVGERIPLPPGDLAASAMTLSAGDQRVRGLASAVLGHPANAVAWLANELSRYGDERLEAGTLILPGALARALPIARGETARARFDGLGEVSASFS